MAQRKQVHKYVNKRNQIRRLSKDEFALLGMVVFAECPQVTASFIETKFLPNLGFIKSEFQISENFCLLEELQAKIKYCLPSRNDISEFESFKRDFQKDLTRYIDNIAPL